jgi:hypothetical protein
LGPNIGNADRLPFRHNVSPLAQIITRCQSPSLARGKGLEIRDSIFQSLISNLPITSCRYTLLNRYRLFMIAGQGQIVRRPQTRPKAAKPRSSQCLGVRGGSPDVFV